LNLQDAFEIAVFAGRAGCIGSLISVARHSSSEFQSMGPADRGSDLPVSRSSLPVRTPEATRDHHAAIFVSSMANAEAELHALQR
jgi:hypothetical protein